MQYWPLTFQSHPGRTREDVRASPSDPFAVTRLDDKADKELALFEQFKMALSDPELLSGTARSGRVNCEIRGGQGQLNEPDVVCSLPSGSVRYFENVQLVSEELMRLMGCPFLDYRKGRLMSESEIPVFETRYQGCYLAYDKPIDERLHLALKRVLRYLVRGEPAEDFGVVDGQISIPYEAIGDDGMLSPRPLNGSWRVTAGEILLDPGIIVTGPLFVGKPRIVPGSPAVRDPAVSLLNKKCEKDYFDPASGLRIYPELILWSADDRGFSLEDSAEWMDSPAPREKWEEHFSAMWLFEIPTSHVLHLNGLAHQPIENEASET